MLRVRVCAAHMGGFLGPKLYGWVFGFESLNLGGFSGIFQKLAKNCKNGFR